MNQGGPTVPNEKPTSRPADELALVDHLKEYRAQLVTLEQQSQASFDRTLLTLSGGALGVSFAFVKDFLAGTQPLKAGFLVGAWGCWVGSLALVLASHYFSVLATRAAIEQVDAGRIYAEAPGRAFATVTKSLNLIGGLAFIGGLVLIAVFVDANL